MKSRPNTILLLLLAGQQVWSLGIPLPLRSPGPMLADSSGQVQVNSVASTAELDARRQRQAGSDGPPAAAMLAPPNVDPKPGLPTNKSPKVKQKVKLAKGKEEMDPSSRVTEAKAQGVSAGGKEKPKHRPGSHHRNDRLDASGNDNKYSPKKGKKTKTKAKKKQTSKQSKRYLSSSPPSHPKREMSLWDYDRHSKRVGPFDPLAGSGMREAHASRWEPDADDYERARPADMAQDTVVTGQEGAILSTFRQGVVLDHGEPHPGSRLASRDHTIQRRALLSLNGRVTFDLFDDLGSIEQRDDQPGPSQNITSTSADVVSVLDGGPRMYADKILWQPTSNHPDVGERDLVRRRKSDNDADDKDEHDSGGGSKYREDYGNGKHGDEGGYGKHRGGEAEDVDDGWRGQTKASPTSGRGKQSHADEYDDEEENDGEYHHGSATSNGRSSKHASAEDGDDEEHSGRRPFPHSSSASSDLDDDDFPVQQRPKPTFDDGQYRPWQAPGSQSNDCATLADFYTSMKGGTWTRDLGWSASSRSRTACCQWTGVTCDAYDRVIGVNLADTGLEGALGEEIFKLDQLVRLCVNNESLPGLRRERFAADGSSDVASNRLTKIPDRFASLPVLANLNASHNNVTGSVPSSLLTHPMLKTLNLGSNSLTGAVTIDSVNITSLALGHNQLSSIDFLEGRNLIKVDLSENRFQGQLPDMTQSVLLEIFDASFNNTGPLFDLTRLTALTRLDVRSNSLSGPFPPTFSHLPRLTSLYLSSNGFSGAFPSEPAPPALRSCYVMPNPLSPCPSDIELAHPESLAARCRVRCPKSPEELASQQKAAGIPVSPLPGEAGQPLDHGAGSQAVPPAWSGQTAGAMLTPPPLGAGR